MKSSTQTSKETNKLANDVTSSRLQLSEDEVSHPSKDQLPAKWSPQNVFLNLAETQTVTVTQSLTDATNSEVVSPVSHANNLIRELEEKLKQQQLASTRRENVLIMKLTMKDQEVQHYLNQIQELKQGQVLARSSEQLQATLVDPAVNLIFERMRKEVESSKAKVEEMQQELSAWKFTPDSQTGKRLMAKCRLLYQENEDLGKLVSSGKVAKLEGDLALQKNFSEEMKKSQAELDEFLVELDEDVEGMQGTIYHLQKQLKEMKESISLNNGTKHGNSSTSDGSEQVLNNISKSLPLPVTPASQTNHQKEASTIENGNGVEEESGTTEQADTPDAMVCD